jgi:hypothetical protein
MAASCKALALEEGYVAVFSATIVTVRQRRTIS